MTAVPAAASLANHRAWPLLPCGLAVSYGIALYPGRWTPDSVAEATETATGRYTDWYAPVFHAFLHLPHTVFPHFGAMLLAQLLLLALGAYGLSRALFSRLASSLVATFLLVYPPVIGWGLVMSRDVWYGVLLLGLAATTSALVLRDHRRGTRIVLWVAAIACLVLGAAVRQNGFVGEIPVVAFFLFTSVRDLPRHRARAVRRTRLRLLAFTTACTTATFLLLIGALRVTTYQLLDAARTSPERVLFIFDIAAISVRNGESVFSPDELDPAQYPELERVFTPTSVWSLIWGPDRLFPLSDPALRFRDSWIAAIREHPLDYLKSRLYISRRLIGAPPVDVPWTYQPTESSRNFAQPWFEHPNRVIDRYLHYFSQSDLHRSVFYGALALLFVVVALWRDDRYRAVGAFCAGALLYTLSLFFAVTVTDNRFNWPLIVAGVIAAAGLGKAGLRFAAERRRAAVTHVRRAQAVADR